MISPNIVKMKPYLDKIGELPENTSLQREDLLSERFLMTSDRNLEMYYAPHNEVINTAARIVIVGITPGLSQMKTAFEAAGHKVSSWYTSSRREALRQGVPYTTPHCPVCGSR